MGNLTITITDVNGETRSFSDIDEGVSLMESAKARDVAGIFGDCGGGCSCATCHVYVAPEWLERVGVPDDVELDMLDMVSDVQRENSRLSCQIAMRAELDGLTVTAAPSSM